MIARNSLIRFSNRSLTICLTGSRNEARNTICSLDEKLALSESLPGNETRISSTSATKKWSVVCCMRGHMAIIRPVIYSFGLEHRNGAPQTRGAAFNDLYVAVAPRTNWTESRILKPPSWRSGIGLVNRGAPRRALEVVYTHTSVAPSSPVVQERRMSATLETKLLARGARLFLNPSYLLGPYNKPRSETPYIPVRTHSEGARMHTRTHTRIASCSR